jgi:hypothetical protein
LKVTLRLKLHLIPATEAVLRETLEQSTACFNAVCRQGWNHDERNGTRLHQATYKTLREAHPQLVVSARMRAAEALQSVQERKRQGRSVSCPHSLLCPVRYEARSYWVRLSDGCASLATTQGRVCVSFRLCDYYTRYADWKPCSADLCLDRKTGAFFLRGLELNADFNAAKNIKTRGECSDALLCRLEGLPSNQAQAPAL